MMRVGLAATIAAVLQLCVWIFFADRSTPVDYRGAITSVSYTPYVEGSDPTRYTDGVPDFDGGTAEQRQQIEHDMRVLSEYAQGVRTYSLIDGADQVPAIAARHGLDVTLGVWIGANEARNKAEMERAIQLANRYPNVRAVMVGNEVLLREELDVNALIGLIHEMKSQVQVPVSTGETWDQWLMYPELAEAVDFLAVHVLPYWGQIPADESVTYTFDVFDRLQRIYPGKPIVLSEFGWPSQGYNLRDAEPGRFEQAEVIRGFLVEARKHDVAYNIVEAFDQPWKVNEGSVGAYWGLFDADRNLKFPLTGAVLEEDVAWRAGVGIALGLLIALAGLLWCRATFGQAVMFALAANGFGAVLAIAIAYPFQNYMNIGMWIMWGVGMVLIVPLTLLALAKVHELASVLFGGRPRRLITRARRGGGGMALPKVSIHVPAYREPADMVIETLNSLARLDYPDFEVIVIVNNTPEAHYSEPVARHCAALGERFRFLDITCKGFKAGALNVAREVMAADAEVIAVIDADYVVEANWLRDLVPYFEDKRVALIQAPQDHRDGFASPLKTMMNAEYAGFFDIGMVQRDAHNAIIQHGTMCLVRRQAMDAVGGWGTDTIVEDTELGLRLFEAGYRARYTNIRYGRGLLPDTVQAFKTQRFRWAYGAMQIARKHWRHLLPTATNLTLAQKMHFLTGWASWIADALGSAASVINLLWVPAILFIGVVIPPPALTLPLIAAFVINLVHCGVLYAKRVDVPLRDVPGAALAAMSLQFTVARAVFTGLVRDSLAFQRTEKGGNGAKAGNTTAVWETRLGVALALSAAILALLNGERITEQFILAAVLAVQSLPFLAATAMDSFERQQLGVRRRPVLARLGAWLGLRGRTRPVSRSGYRRPLRAVVRRRRSTPGLATLKPSPASVGESDTGGPLR